RKARVPYSPPSVNSLRNYSFLYSQAGSRLAPRDGSMLISALRLARCPRPWQDYSRSWSSIITSARHGRAWPGGELWRPGSMRSWPRSSTLASASFGVEPPFGFERRKTAFTRSTKAERLGGLEVHEHLEFCRKLNG